MKALSRLRWQLTLSHLLAIAFTLMSMIAAVIFIGGTWWTSIATSSRQPEADARGVALAIGGMLQNGSDTNQLDAVLSALASGNLRATVGFGPIGPRGEPVQVGLRDIAYVVLLDPNGQLLAGSTAAGADFAPPEQQEWQTLVNDSGLSGGMVVRHAAGPAALGTAPVLDQAGQRLATVIVATTSLPAPAARGFDFVRGLAAFGVASIAVLAAASVFALISSGVVAYLLSRSLVRRLERLGQAARSLASGDLSQRVDGGPADEIGLLARRFNGMADDLQLTMGELRAERDRVAGLLEERRELVASASHELRTPVATVRGYLESALGQRDTLTPELLLDLETMQREVLRLQELIDDLFALSQAAVGKLSLRLEPTDVGAVVRRLVGTTAPLAWRQRRVQVLVDTQASGSATATATVDEQRLEQIVSNLLGNAVRHTPPGGLVAAAVCAEPGAIVVQVRDTGEGIAPEDAPHIFERFYRGHSANGGGGAGLGLALVKEFTEAMGGTVEAASTPGEGSSFTVRLPRAP